MSIFEKIRDNLSPEIRAKQKERKVYEKGNRELSKSLRFTEVKNVENLLEKDLQKTGDKRHAKNVDENAMNIAAARTEDNLRESNDQENLNLFDKSNLYLESSSNIKRIYGNIEGSRIFITEKLDKATNDFIYSGDRDDVALSEEEAKEIFKKYYIVASKQTEELEKIGKQAEKGKV
jgi:hypothetical protein